jgi:hypothetical protein
MKKDWKYFFSPCKICATLCLVLIIAGLVSIGSSGGFSLYVVFVMGPALLLLLAIDWTVKKIIGNKIKLVCVVEVIIIVVLVCIFYESIAAALFALS